MHLKVTDCCSPNKQIRHWTHGQGTNSSALLGRLPKVDLIILEGGECLSVRLSVRPQKVSSISMKFGIQVEVDE